MNLLSFIETGPVSAVIDCSQDTIEVLCNSTKHNKFMHSIPYLWNIYGPICKILLVSRKIYYVNIMINKGEKYYDKYEK